MCQGRVIRAPADNGSSPRQNWTKAACPATIPAPHQLLGKRGNEGKSRWSDKPLFIHGASDHACHLCWANVVGELGSAATARRSNAQLICSVADISSPHSDDCSGWRGVTRDHEASRLNIKPLASGQRRSGYHRPYSGSLLPQMSQPFPFPGMPR